MFRYRFSEPEASPLRQLRSCAAGQLDERVKGVFAVRESVLKRATTAPLENKTEKFVILKLR